MKIFFSTFYDSSFGMGGAEQVLLDLAASIQSHSGDVALCAVNPGDLSDRLRQAGVRVVELPRTKAKTWKILEGYRSILHAFRPDIQHSFHRYSAFLLDLFFSNHAPIIYTEQVLRRDRRLFFRYGHRVTACHETVRQNLIAHYGVRPDRVVTIPNAVKKRDVSAAKLEGLRARYPRSGGEVFALCTGRLEEQKGHRYLIGALKVMNPEIRRRLKMFLAGEGSLRPSLMRMAGEAGVHENLVFLGHVPEVPEYLALCDFFVLPSLWEGLPLSVLEAYSQERPVLATDIPGTRESVQIGVTGFLVPPADENALALGLERCVRDAQGLRAMGRAAAQWWAREFSFERMIEGYRKLYREMLLKKNPS